MTTNSLNVLAYLRERLTKERRHLDHLVSRRQRIYEITDDDDRVDILDRDIAQAQSAISALESQIGVLEKIIAADDE